MIRLSEQLKSAIRVPIMPGQFVIVRKHNGDKVVEGWVTDVEPKVGIVRVQDDAHGIDMRVDVDPSKYDLWIKSPGGALAQYIQAKSLYILAKNR